MTSFSPFKLPRAIVLITAFVLLLAGIIALDLTPWVRGGYGWRWPYIPVAFMRVLPLLLTTAVYLAGVWLVLTRTRRVWPALAWGLLGTVALSLVVTYAREGQILYPLFTRTASAFTTGPHWAATQIDWQGGEWRDWTAVMGRLGGHLGTSPPGLPMWYGLLNDLLGRVPTAAESLQHSLIGYQCHNYDLLTYTPSQWGTAWFGILMPLWAGLTVFPLLGIAQRLNPAWARIVPLWWALVPGIASFAASWSTFYPFMSASAFYLLLIGLQNRRQVWIFIAGLLCGIALFLHFTFVPILGMFGFFTLGYGWFALGERGAIFIRRCVFIGIVFGVGLIIPWVVFWLLTGETAIDLLRASLAYHLDLERPYWFWVWMHVWDWALWSGMGLALVWLFGLGFWWRQHRERLQTQNPPILSMALLLTILVLTISGTTRGESGRIWLFLSPFVLVAAREGLLWFRNSDTRQMNHAFFAITASQAILMVALTANLAVIGTDFSRPPAPPPLTVEGVHPIDAAFAIQDEGEVFRLVGWHAEPSDNEILLTLRWQASQPMTMPYWFGATLVQGDVVTEAVIWQPRALFGPENRYPTTCWPSGRVIEDQITLPYPQGGEWWVSLAAFGDATQPEGRLQVMLPEAPPGVQVGLGPVVTR